MLSSEIISKITDPYRIGYEHVVNAVKGSSDVEELMNNISQLRDEIDRTLLAARQALDGEEFEDPDLIDIEVEDTFLETSSRPEPKAKTILWASLECTNFSKAKGGQALYPDIPEDMSVEALEEVIENIAETVWNNVLRHLERIGRPVEAHEIAMGSWPDNGFYEWVDAIDVDGTIISADESFAGVTLLDNYESGNINLTDFIVILRDLTLF